MTDSHLVDTVSECVRNPANYGSPDFTGGHLAQFDRGRLAVEGGVGSHYQVGRVFQRGVACRDQRSVLRCSIVRATIARHYLHFLRDFRNFLNLSTDQPKKLQKTGSRMVEGGSK